MLFLVTSFDSLIQEKPTFNGNTYTKHKGFTNSSSFRNRVWTFISPRNAVKNTAMRNVCFLQHSSLLLRLLFSGMCPSIIHFNASEIFIILMCQMLWRVSCRFCLQMLLRICKMADGNCLILFISLLWITSVEEVYSTEENVHNVNIYCMCFLSTMYTCTSILLCDTINCFVLSRGQLVLRKH